MHASAGWKLLVAEVSLMSSFLLLWQLIWFQAVEDSTSWVPEGGGYRIEVLLNSEEHITGRRNGPLCF